MGKGELNPIRKEVREKQNDGREVGYGYKYCMLILYDGNKYDIEMDPCSDLPCWRNR